MSNRPPIIAGITAVASVAIILSSDFTPANPPPSATLTDITDKSALANKTELAHISIATGENYIGNRIRVISGVVKNTSDKSLRLVEVKMTFTDFDGKPIQESVQRAYENLRKPLDPGV